MQETCGERHDKLVEAVHDIALRFEGVEAELSAIPDKIELAVLKANNKTCEKLMLASSSKSDIKPAAGDQPAVILSQKNVTTVGVIILMVLEILKTLIGKT